MRATPQRDEGRHRGEPSYKIRAHGCARDVSQIRGDRKRGRSLGCFPEGRIYRRRGKSRNREPCARARARCASPLAFPCQRLPRSKFRGHARSLDYRTSDSAADLTHLQVSRPSFSYAEYRRSRSRPANGTPTVNDDVTSIVVSRRFDSVVRYFRRFLRERVFLARFFHVTYLPLRIFATGNRERNVRNSEKGLGESKELSDESFVIFVKRISLHELIKSPDEATANPLETLNTS